MQVDIVHLFKQSPIGTQVPNDRDFQERRSRSHQTGRAQTKDAHALCHNGYVGPFRIEEVLDRDRYRTVCLPPAAPYLEDAYRYSL